MTKIKRPRLCARKLRPTKKKLSFFAFIKDEEGSAIIEFIILALPLFIPIVIYLTAVNQSAQIQYEAQNLSRQIARVYVTSPNQELTGARIQAVVDTFKSQSFPSSSVEFQPKIQIYCSLDPCLTPNGKVEVTIFFTSSKSGKSASAKSIQTVDAWRNS